MNRVILLYLFFSVTTVSCIYKSALYRLYPASTPWHHVPFDEAMQKNNYLQNIPKTQYIVKIDGDALYTRFKNLYDQFNLSVIEPSNTLKIPKVIHQIWLGSPVPDVYKPLMQTWIDYHVGRGWEYKLWTDENVHEITLHNQQFYDATDNYGIKSDILRWEILYQQGGLYVDMDYECYRSFDIFHYTYDFYTGIQPLDTFFVQLGAALVGSRPGHPILKHCIETVKNDWHEKGAPKKTGPVHYSKSFYKMAGKDGNIDIALPPFYVYPLYSQEQPSDKKCKQYVAQGSFANHWWSKSWMPAHHRPDVFKNLGNDASTVSWND